jgi:glycosyltransferase involved in cell wall biosynthesis
MNIVLISKYARTQASGHPTRQFLLAKYLSNKKCNVTLISSVSNGVQTDLNQFDKDGFIYRNVESGVENWVIGGPSITLGMSLKRLWSMFLFELRLFLSIPKIAEINPSVVIVSSLALPTIINGILIKWLTGAKLVFEVRDIWPLTLIEIGGFSAKSPLIKLLAWVEKQGYRSADLVVGTMPKLKEHVDTILDKDVTVEHVPMGYDPDFYLDVPQQLPEHIQQKIPQHQFIVGYAGTIGKVNGIDQILEAAALLDGQNVPIHFIFMGDGIEKNGYQRTYASLKNVTWISFQPKRYVDAFLVQCDVLVHPILSKSIYRYGVSPNKWIDYMYSARPIICPYDGYPSIINEAGCGVFIESENSELFAQTILDFASKPKSELDAMGARGKAYLESHLSYDVLADDYLSHLNRLVK